MIRKSALHIQAIVADIPARCETVREAAADLGLDTMQARMFHRLFGLDRLPLDPGLSLQALLGNVVRRLSGAAPDAVARATHLLHCHTIPQVRIAPDGVKPMLPDKVEYMSLTMAHCASGLVGLRVLEDLIPDGLTGILVIGEKAFHRRVRLIEDTTIMSDGAVAMALGRDPGRWRLAGHHVT